MTYAFQDLLPHPFIFPTQREKRALRVSAAHVLQSHDLVHPVGVAASLVLARL